ncbi:hypothetical protein ENBRE01_1997 [Enteropsectra breve]|nr:hypothetical protein ENBRE01_1997 [Enteropsectra breve]
MDDRENNPYHSSDAYGSSELQDTGLMDLLSNTRISNRRLMDDVFDCGEDDGEKYIMERESALHDEKREKGRIRREREEAKRNGWALADRNPILRILVGYMGVELFMEYKKEIAESLLDGSIEEKSVKIIENKERIESVFIKEIKQ